MSDDEKLIRWDVVYTPAEMAAAYNRLRAMYDEVVRERAALQSEIEKYQERAWRAEDAVKLWKATATGQPISR